MKGSLSYFGVLVLFTGVLAAELLLIQIAPNETVHIQSTESMLSAWNQSSQNHNSHTYGLDSYRSKVLQARVERR